MILFATLLPAKILPAMVFARGCLATLIRILMMLPGMRYVASVSGAASYPPQGCRILIGVALLGIVVGAADANESEDFFEARIRPVLVGTCFRCHGETKTGGSLRVDTRDNLMKGGDSGAAIVPGKPEESLLIQAIRRGSDVSAMPPDKAQALRADQIADFAKWIRDGAVWPSRSAKFVAERHWAFEPLGHPAVPEVKDKAWNRSSIDRFIRQRQEAANLRPAAVADKRTLIRRATLDLTGLPPTAEDIEEFLSDESPDAFEVVVDRLLRSPAYGEHWGRHWLDVVRYADTAGETADYPAPHAWRYRNYVVDSLNADLPYDQFVREQIAGDVLATRRPDVRYSEQIKATGYLAISRRFGFDSENYHHLTIQDTIDTLGQSILGLSLGCARCHDHKFDPVTMQDYYALFGIFDSTRYPFPGSEQKQKIRSLALLVPPSEVHSRWREHETRVATLTDQLQRLGQAVPPGLLRSLHDMDGDFELQAPAAGGSNGVLVPPWQYEGPIAVTNAAQSPYKNVYTAGRSGASIANDAGPYRIVQAIHPRRTANAKPLFHVNLDFRVAAPGGDRTGVHRFVLGDLAGHAVVELAISAESIAAQVGDKFETLATLKPNTWHNLQLSVDLQGKRLSGRVGVPGAVSEFVGVPLSNAGDRSIEVVTFAAIPTAEGKLPAWELDNFSIQEAPFPDVTTDAVIATAPGDRPDIKSLSEKLQSLMGIDGDLELQVRDEPPKSPWNPGPNSLVKLTTAAQSPFQNLYPSGELGLQLPNRAEYDGFGLTLSKLPVNADGVLYASFDFRCRDNAANGMGSWRYYLGHGAGSNTAIELFFNDREFFQKQGDDKLPVASLKPGTWYQVRLKINLREKNYVGELSFTEGSKEFSGQLAQGWDGQLDYTFIDSYGHIPGIRPALDADNFFFSDKPLPKLDEANAAANASRATRMEQIAEIRRQMAAVQANAAGLRQELEQVLALGMHPMAYAMAEGTPHHVRLHRRGEPDQPGDEVPRGFLRVLGGGPLPGEVQGSGRIELAEWLTGSANTLPARVIANRVWQYHFGRGLVKTPNDFGIRGMPPTHPELLEHLADELVRSGWSLKSLHRVIMLSAVYQQACLASAEDTNTARDATNAGDTGAGDSSGSAENTGSPGNVGATGNNEAVSQSVESRRTPQDLYVGFARRRLSAEEIRDAILVASGGLDNTPGTTHPFPAPTTWGYSQHAPFTAVYDHSKRSVYLMTQRLKRHPFLALFDGADPNATTADRLITTVPTQALFFLNDPFVHALADQWAANALGGLSVVDRGEPARWIDLAYRSAYGRLPDDVERSDAVDFVRGTQAELASGGADQPDRRALAALLRTLLASNEFLHVE